VFRSHQLFLAIRFVLALRLCSIVSS